MIAHANGATTEESARDTADASEAGEAGQFLTGEATSTNIPAHPDALPSANAVASSTGSANGGAVHAILRRSAHPTAAVFHVAFKLAAVVSYLVLGLFTSNFVIQFVTTVTLIAFDFWTVKNVSGRLLVGLRWWHDVSLDDENDSTSDGWRFESVPDRDSLNATDSRIFWWTLYATPLVWVLLGVVCVLKFNVSDLVIVVIAVVLSAANITGYYKCNKDATEQMRAYIGKTMLGHAMERSGLGQLARFVS